MSLLVFCVSDFNPEADERDTRKSQMFTRLTEKPGNSVYIFVKVTVCSIKESESFCKLLNTEKNLSY